MEKKERDHLSDPKTPKKIGSSGREVRRVAKPHKHKETSAAPFLAPHRLNSMQYFYPQFHYTDQHALARPNSHIYYYPPVIPSPAPQQYTPHAYSVWDSTLPVSVKGEDIPSEKNPGSRRQKVKGSSEAVGLCGGDRSSRSEKELGTTSKTNYTHNPSRSVACGYEASSDETDHTNQDSAKKKPRLNQINDYEHPMVADSTADNLETAPNLEKSDTFRESLSKTTKATQDNNERKRKLNRESAKRSRLRRRQNEELQRRIEELKADSNELCVQLKNLSKECGRLEDENNQIKEELVEMYGPSAIYDPEASCSEMSVM